MNQVAHETPVEGKMVQETNTILSKELPESANAIVELEHLQLAFVGGGSGVANW